MSWYELLLYLHIGSAIIWLGSGFLTIVLHELAYRSGDPAHVVRRFVDEQMLSTRLFIPAALFTLAMGILLVIVGGWGFTTPWILVGLAGFASTFVTGITFLKPSAERIAEAVGEDGTITPEVTTAMKKRLLVLRIDMAVLFTVVFDMAVKPSASELPLLLVPGALLVLFAVSASRPTDKSGPPTQLAIEGAPD